MRRCLGLGLLCISTVASAEVVPKRLICVGTGTWVCTEGDICIDGPQGKGNRYAFDLRKLTYKSSTGDGPLVAPTTDEAGRMTFNLDDGRRFLDRVIDDERGIVSYLFNGSDHVVLRCKRRGR